MSAQTQDEVKVVKGGKTCVVGCKLPNGLHLDIARGKGEPVERVSIRGSNADARNDKGKPLFPGRIAVAGFGITDGVNEEHFDAWMHLHQHLPMVRNGLIFKMKNVASAIDAANDNGSVLNGLEPLDPEKQLRGFDKVQTLELTDKDR